MTNLEEINTSFNTMNNDTVKQRSWFKGVDDNLIDFFFFFIPNAQIITDRVKSHQNVQPQLCFNQLSLQL